MVNNNDYDNKINHLKRYINNPLLLTHDLTEILEITTADLDKCVDLLKANPGDQIWERLVVRTAFSVIEAICYKLKVLVFCYAKYGGDTLPQEDELFLLGLKINEKGYAKNHQYRLKENVERTIETSAKYFRINIVVHGTKESELLEKAVNVRRKITHPKDANDLAVSQEESGTVSDAFSWFMKCVLAITIASSGVAKIE